MFVTSEKAFVCKAQALLREAMRKQGIYLMQPQQFDEILLQIGKLYCETEKQEELF